MTHLLILSLLAAPPRPTPASASAPKPHWAASWASIRATSSRVVGVDADFVQKKRMPLLLKPLVSRGRLRFTAPTTLRWEYHAPLRTLMTIERGQVRRFVWQKGAYQSTGGGGAGAMRVVLKEVTAWLAGRFRSSTNFTASLVLQPSPRIVLVPKKAALKRFILRITLVLAAQPGALARVEIQEVGRAETVLEFTRCQLRLR